MSTRYPLSPEQLAVIREVALAGLTGSGYPNLERLQAMNPSPWVYDELIQDGFLFVSIDLVFPTIKSLKIFDESIFQNFLVQARTLFFALKNIYEQQPLEPLSLEAMHAISGLDEDKIRRILPLLRALNIFTNSVGLGDTGWLSRVVLHPCILALDPFEQGQPEDDAHDGEVCLLAKDFRGLASLQWDINGVCLLAGSNGAGKTSILEALSFLRTFFLGGPEEAMRQVRGAFGLRRVGAAPRALVELEIKIGKVRWMLKISVGEGSSTAVGEDVLIDAKPYLHRSPSAGDWYLGKIKRRGDERCCLRAAYDEARPSVLAGLVRVLRGFRVYGHYNLEDVRNGAPVIEEGRILREDGRNMLSVLRAWQSAPTKYDMRFEWVMDQARQAFPEQIARIEFETVGSLVQARFFRPGATTPDRGLPFHVASDGMLAGLLHLTAIAGADEGSLLAFEELENHMHPHAIRVMIKAIHEVAEKRDLRVVLTTHSLSLMNEFRRDYEHFFVLEPGNPQTPVRLDELRDPDYLAQFYPGDLYDREDFGAPKTASKERQGSESD